MSTPQDPKSLQDQNRSRRSGRTGVAIKATPQGARRTAVLNTTTDLQTRGRTGNGLTKMAGTPQVVRAIPKTYSPLYEMSNLQLPRDQKTMNAWNRHFYECFSGDTETLTDNGWKTWDKIDIDSDLIGVFNPETEELEFQKAVKLAIYDYDSEQSEPMVHFQTNKVDILVTPNHRMWVDRLHYKGIKWKNEWRVEHAEDVKKYTRRFRSIVNWKGAEPPSTVTVADETVDIVTYLQWTALYITEGSIHRSEDRSKRYHSCIAQNQYRKEVLQSSFVRVQSVISSLPFKTWQIIDSWGLQNGNHQDGAKGIKQFGISGQSVAEHLALEFGEGSANKKIPKWIKNLSPKYLKVFVDALLLGDGTISYSDSYARQGTNHVAQYIYSTISKQLADDVYEMVFKLGYAPTLTTETKHHKNKMHLVHWTKGETGNFPVLKSNSRQYKGKEIQRVPYKGIVYCLHVPPHNLFVTRRNGKATIQGNTNPLVRNAVNLHATYPISKFQITCDEPVVREFFEDMFDHLNMPAVLLELSLEYWKLGEAFPYCELDEDNGTWDYIFCHNPDFIRVKTNVLTRHPIITLVPDDALRRLVNSQNPTDLKLRDDLPPEVLYYLQRGEDIPLPNFNVSHLKMLSSAYDVRGTSVITSCFKDLMLWDKIREAKFIQADDMINPITLVKLGDPNGQWKPNDEDIAEFQRVMEESQYDLDFKIVTHGAVNIEKIGNSGAILDMSGDWDVLVRNIMNGLFVTEGVLSGEGPNYATAGIGLEVLRARYERFRNHVTMWMVKKVIEPICKLQDFYKYENGERKLIVPKVMWNKINLRDVDAYIGQLTGFLSQEPGTPGTISKRTVMEFLDIDLEEERERMREEMITDWILSNEKEALAKKTLEELRTLDPKKPIIDTHPNEEAQIPGEQEGEGGEMGLEDLGGGIAGGGGGGNMGNLFGGEEEGGLGGAGGLGGGEMLGGEQGGGPGGGEAPGGE